MPILNMLPVNTENDDEHYETLVQQQAKTNKNHDTPRNYNFTPIGSTVVVQREDGGP